MYAWAVPAMGLDGGFMPTTVLAFFTTIIDDGEVRLKFPRAEFATAESIASMLDKFYRLAQRVYLLLSYDIDVVKTVVSN